MLIYQSNIRLPGRFVHVWSTRTRNRTIAERDFLSATRFSAIPLRNVQLRVLPSAANLFTIT
jgi:hypothetical protein